MSLNLAPDLYARALTELGVTEEELLRLSRDEFGAVMDAHHARVADWIQREQDRIACAEWSRQTIADKVPGDMSLYRAHLEGFITADEFESGIGVVAMFEDAAQDDPQPDQEAVAALLLALHRRLTEEAAE